MQRAQGPVSDDTSACRPSSTRYVLVYSTRSAPEGFSWVAHSVNLLADNCCESYGTWGDPHLTHVISMMCPKCKRSTANFQLTASDAEADEENAAERNHLVVSCPKGCGGETKVRILRRGRGPITTGQDNKPILEVEVIGKLLVSEKFVGNPYFQLYGVDGQNQLYKTDFHKENPDGSWDLQVEKGIGFVKGFKGQWEKADWGDKLYDGYGLRILDEHNAVRQGWPPKDWTSEGDGEDGEDGEGNVDLVGEGNGGQGIADHGGNDNQYTPSDCESNT